MAVRPIRLFGDPVLRSVTDPVRIGAPGNAGLVEDLVDSVALEGRAGVAANQIGVGLRAFTVNVDGRIDYVLNPEIVELGGEPALVDEGCLSVPGFYFPRMRHPYAKVRGLDLAGEEIVLEGAGLMAQALQHETDHLDGKLYIEGLEPETKREAMRAVRQAEWFGRSVE
ncbi:peptide deformylase [Homoserinibacter sp. YIM 151385]|uniref:peptide deformylase n=1 Tax=Homoserinibacter sp. YIM 151385 TaxID=2985506 RepID=UPI0022F07AC5|nr:peptide deformylase [Homoserinibacter sp. YIM 151385]WBU38756.1 peptide deformylase [Homoserinibacter sp. YIM 151385]